MFNFTDRFEFVVRDQSLGMERVFLDRALHRHDPARKRTLLDPGRQGIRESGQAQPQPVVRQHGEDQSGGGLPVDVRSRFEESSQRRSDGQRIGGHQRRDRVGEQRLRTFQTIFGDPGLRL